MFDYQSNAACKKVPVDCFSLFGFKVNFPVFAFSDPSEIVPAIDENYCFDENITKALLIGFMFNKKVLLHGLHGTGKSTHIEQVAARLNWPVMRINLDGHMSRSTLLGRDVIALQDGKQITRFEEGVIPFSIQRPVALVFDEYDAARADMLFILQRMLEKNGALTLTDQNRIIYPHADFRIFATANTIGLGDSTGLYHGTQPLNHGQLDRWEITVLLNYLTLDQEKEIIRKKSSEFMNSFTEGEALIHNMVMLAHLTRNAFKEDEISTLLSPRTVLNWAENSVLFGSIEKGFEVSFLNKCDEIEKIKICELYQRCFGIDLAESSVMKLYAC